MARKQRKPNMQRKNVKPKSQVISHAFINQQYEALAALGWAGYIAEGRGYVLLAFEEDGSLGSSYIGKNGESWSELLMSEFTEIVELVDKYDPEKQIVVVNTTNQFTEVWIAADLPLPPPIAYAKYSASME